MSLFPHLFLTQFVITAMILTIIPVKIPIAKSAAKDFISGELTKKKQELLE